MHLDAFSIHHRLSDWPDCWLELRCPTPDGRMVQYPVKLLLAQRGDRSFEAALGKLRCKCCGRMPRPVYLVAGTMREPGKGGGGLCWAVMLVG